MESQVLALPAGLLGILATPWISGLLEVAAPRFPLVNRVSLDARSVLFLLTLTALSALLSGGLAAARGWRTPARLALQQNLSRTTSRKGLAGALMALQFSVATALSVGAGLMAVTFIELNRVNLGFEPEGVLSFRIALRPELGRDPERSRDLVGRLLASVERLPGVSAAALGSIPLSGGASDLARTEEEREGVRTRVNAVSPDYFRVLGTPLLRGRPLVDADRGGGLPVAVVSESLSRRLWPQEEETLGKRVALEREPPPRQGWKICKNQNSMSPRDLRPPTVWPIAGGDLESGGEATT